MKWNRILPYLSQGGAIRRESWEEERWVELGEEALYSFPIFLLDQNGEEVELLDEDLKASDWEYCEDEVESPYLELSYERLLNRAKTKSLTKIAFFGRTLQLLMNDYAEQHNCVATWNDTSTKYYIECIPLSNDFYVEETKIMQGLTTVYFTKKEVAEQFIKEYRHLIEDVLTVVGIRGILFNSQNLTKDDVLELMETMDGLGNKRYW